MTQYLYNAMESSPIAYVLSISVSVGFLPLSTCFQSQASPSSLIQFFKFAIVASSKACGNCGCGDKHKSS
jgi:hypothetical protein